jgi:hypothetical protein
MHLISGETVAADPIERLGTHNRPAGSPIVRPKAARQLATQTSPFPANGGEPRSSRTVLPHGNDVTERLNVLVWVDSGKSAFGQE